MHAATLLRQPLRTLVITITVPLTLAAIADDVCLR